MESFNKYLKSILLFTLNIKEEDIKKKIYFLDNTDKEYNENGKNVENDHDNLQELNANNTKLYMVNKLADFGKYFIPEKAWLYEIKLEFKMDWEILGICFAGAFKIPSLRKKILKYSKN